LIGNVQPDASGAWAYKASAFVTAYGAGSVILLDELDRMDEGVLAVLNSALANGYIDTPDGRIERHADTLILAAANTWGTGDDVGTYTAAGCLDAASLNRFAGAKLEVNYDHKLEVAISKATCGSDKPARWVQTMRKRVASFDLPYVLTTREVEAGAKDASPGHDLSGYPRPLNRRMVRP
jgi:cobaltochelatase CobS